MFNAGHIISLALILFGIIVIIIPSLIIKHKKGNCSVKINSVVSKLNSHHNYRSNNDIRHSAVCTFVYNGTEYTVDRIGYSTSKRVGDTQTLYIDPQNPEKCYAKRDFLIPIFIVAWGACVVLGGIINFIISF